VGWWRGTARGLAVVIAAALAFEAGANYLLWLDSGRLPALEWLAGRAAATAPLREFVTRIHPYFGFIHGYTREWAAANGMVVNDYGFSQRAAYAARFPEAGVFPLLPEQHPDLFIVGVFGNSIARGIADFMQEAPWVQERLATLPAARGRRVLILNFAVGGHRQPQPFLVLAYLLSLGMRIDLALSFGAANEVFNGKLGMEQGWSAAFPLIHTWEPLTRSLEPSAVTDERALLGQLFTRLAANARGRIEGCRLASCIALNRMVAKGGGWLGRALTPVDEDAQFRHFARDPLGAAAREPVLPFLARLWQRATLMMAAATRETGGRFLGLLMPSPWVHPSGRPPYDSTAEEAAEERPVHAAALPELVRVTRELAGQGVPMLDASRLMDDHPADDPALFLDHHGHLGAEGLRRVLVFTLDALDRPDSPAPGRQP
jgi:hypothetical protein